MSPAGAHLTCGMRDAASAEVARHILDQTPAIVVVKPVLQVMQARKILTRALTAAISILLDVIQHAFRRPARFRIVQHSRETERDLEKRPAIHAVEIHRRRLDPVVDLQSEMFVARPDQSLSNGRSAFANRQRFPVFCLRLCNYPIELVLSLKNGAKW